MHKTAYIVLFPGLNSPIQIKISGHLFFSSAKRTGRRHREGAPISRLSLQKSINLIDKSDFPISNLEIDAPWRCHFHQFARLGRKTVFRTRQICEHDLKMAPRKRSARATKIRSVPLQQKTHTRSQLYRMTPALCAEIVQAIQGSSL